MRGSSTSMSTPGSSSSSGFLLPPPPPPPPSSSSSILARKDSRGTTRPCQRSAISSKPVNGACAVLKASFFDRWLNCPYAPCPKLYTWRGVVVTIDGGKERKGVGCEE